MKKVSTLVFQFFIVITVFAGGPGNGGGSGNGNGGPPTGPPGNGGGNPPGPCFPPGNCVPIDGGLGFLLLAGAAYGSKKVYDISKKEKAD